LSDVISIRVSKELKERMKKYPIDWSREVRRFLEERVRVLELLEIVDEIEKRAAKRRTQIDSTLLIREEREKQ
jgi:hypothetical protein